MKIVGILLILAALVGGGVILSDTVPGYFRNKDTLARSRAEAVKAQKELAALPANATENDIRFATSHAQSMVDQIRFDEESVERRRNETLMFGGGALAVLALGGFLFVRGRRKKPAGGTAISAATALS